MADHDKKKATGGYSYIKNKNSKLEGSSSTIDVQALSLHKKKHVNKNNNNGNIIDNNNGKNENNSKNNAEHQNLNDENAKPVINDYACMVKFEKSLKHILQSFQNCEKYEKLVIAKKQNEKGDNIEINVKIDDRCNYDEKSDFLEDNLNEINVAKRKACIYEKQARCNPFEAIPMHYEPIIKELNNQEHSCNFICNNNKNLNIVSHFEKANIANNDSKHVSNSNNDNDKKLVIYPQNDLQLKWIKLNETLNIARNELNSYSSDVYKTNDVLNTQNNLSFSHEVNVEIYTNNFNGTNCVQDDNLQRYSDHGFNNLSLSKLNDQLSVKKMTSKSVDEIINFNIIKELPFQDRLSNGIISFSEIRFCLIRKACIVFLKRAKCYLDAHILSTTTSTTKHTTLLSVLNDVTHSYNCYS
ncbi:hypothetical protein HELRODRAFT_173205 [Helobdella robusta]|uniref:Uncharacterized protein n=1 Tax=Helobdella robusta TaxID=6412 RepID=T1F6K3_HELRO|nr:hypothetical protein HELRODRAFT_173205 [Helobdella robusta]ESO04117.1 hypothetical protein HELRODRAFT_173205 [Helobdella robusta]